MTRLRTFIRLASVPALFLLIAITTRAAQESANAAEEPVGVTFKWIHFVIIAIILVWLFGKALPPVFRSNAETISSAISSATAAKAEADRKLNEAVGKLAHLEREIAEFRVVAARDAAAEAERLRKATVTDAEKVAAAAREEIQAAERAALNELRVIGANSAVDRAEALVAQQMNPATQESLFNSFVQTLQGRLN
jgi:F-type H+-transporting ATPase subunit b